MVLYTIGIFFLYLMWASGGFALHISLDLVVAKKTKKNFKLAVFKDRNKYHYLSSALFIVLTCGLLATSPTQIKELPVLEIMGISLPYQIYIVIVGYSEGAALKKFLKLKNKQNN